MHTAFPWPCSAAFLALSLLTSCAKQGSLARTDRSVTILHANDTYRILGLPEDDLGGVARLRTLRTRLEADGAVIVTHAGDLLAPSLLSKDTHGAHMIDALNHLDGQGDAYDERLVITVGNHEFDRGDCSEGRTLEGMLDDSEFAWVTSNVVWGPKAGSGCDTVVASSNTFPHRVIDAGGLRVAIVSASTGKTHPDFVQDFLDPQTVLREQVPALRADGADVVIALTHLGVDEDRALLASLGDARPDVLLGGHDHAAISEQVEGTWLLKADADLLSAQVVRITLAKDGTLSVAPTLAALDASIPPDPAVDRLAKGHVAAFDARWCGARGLDNACLDAVVGKTATVFDLDETHVRTVETGAADWLADLALDAHRTDGAQVALLNSGSLRLNRRLPAGATLTRRHLEELFPFPTDLRLVHLTGAQLLEVLTHSVHGWTGSGHWLQVAGIRFTHDPTTASVRDLVQVLDDGTTAPIAPTDRLIAVVPRYLVDPTLGDRDGYTMLLPSDVLSGVQTTPLRKLVEAALAGAGADGIQATKDGRICNTLHQACPAP